MMKVRPSVPSNNLLQKYYKREKRILEFQRASWSVYRL